MKRRWFRLYTEILSHPGVALLAPQDRWLYVCLLCAEAAGLLAGPASTLRARKVAVSVGLGPEALAAGCARVAEVGLIDPVLWHPLGWEERQFQSDFDRTCAERQRRHRELSRVTGALCHGRVTRTDTDTDTDTDTEAVRPEKQDALVAGARKHAPFDPRPMLRLYSEKLPMLPQPRALSPARRRSLAARWRDSFDESLATWGEFLDRVGQSSFLTGRAAPAPGHSRWRCDLDFLLKPEKINAIAEGKYDDQA